MTAFRRDPDGDLRWRRTPGAYIEQIVVGYALITMIGVVANAYSTIAGVATGALIFVLATVYIRSWKLTLSTNGLITFGALIMRKRTIEASDIHAIAVPSGGLVHPGGVRLLVAERIATFPFSLWIRKRNRVILAEELATWAECEVVTRAELQTLGRARNGNPKPGHTRITTRRP